jgi:hydrogenase-4 component F
VSGLLLTDPWTGRAFLAAMLALMGLPPFGLLTSEVMIFRGGLESGHPVVVMTGLGLLVIAFAGLLRSLHTMLHGEGRHDARPASRAWAPLLAMGVALGLLVATGLAWPPGLAAALGRVAAVVGPGS